MYEKQRRKHEKYIHRVKLKESRKATIVYYHGSASSTCLSSRKQIKYFFLALKLCQLTEYVMQCRVWLWILQMYVVCTWVYYIHWEHMTRVLIWKFREDISMRAANSSCHFLLGKHLGKPRKNTTSIFLRQTRSTVNEGRVTHKYNPANIIVADQNRSNLILYLLWVCDIVLCRNLISF